MPTAWHSPFRLLLKNGPKTFKMYMKQPFYWGKSHYFSFNSESGLTYLTEDTASNGASNVEMKREPPESGGEEWQQSQTNSYVATWAAEAARMGQGQSAAAAAGQAPEGGVSWNAQQQPDSSYQQAPAAAASNYASADPVNGRSRENSCERAAHQVRSSRSRSPSRGDPRVRVPADRRSHTPVSHSSPSQQSASGNSRLLSPSHGGTPGNGAMGMADHRGASPASSQQRQVTANGHSRRSKSPQLLQAMSQDNAPPQGLDSGPGDPEGGILEDVSDISEDDNIPDAPAMAATESAQPDLTSGARGPEPKDEAMDTSGGGATGQPTYSIL